MNNSLAEVHPELVSEWSEKNLPLTPDDITFANKKVFSIIGGGFTIGLSILGIGCVIGLAIGLVLGVSLALYLPAAISIPYFFSTLRDR